LEEDWDRMGGERDRGVAPNLEQYLGSVFLSSPPNECSQNGDCSRQVDQREMGVMERSMQGFSHVQEDLK
jgi:hypothetical protein